MVELTMMLRSMKQTPAKKRPIRYRKMSYTYKDIAETKGVTIHAVRQAVKCGLLDPSDLKSVCAYLNSRRGRPKKSE